ncbi:hypothetical protein NE237_014142 [Protea cynaroides]|uniref:Uncharacterized protein n=1 Tax=Protea cynaroides TaxID=273540 RepID=A0A9Q0H195_9MAGN|nr:hypothetical protein NE237_014142 [Protea cynaroides]
MVAILRLYIQEHSVTLWQIRMQICDQTFLAETSKGFNWLKGPSPTPGPSSATAGPPLFAPSWRVHSTDSGLRIRVVAWEIIHHTWLLSDAQTLRAIPLEVIDRDQSAAIYQLICGSNHYHRMLSTALDKLMGVQAAALESERLMVTAQNERDAAITAKVEMEGQLKAADERLLVAEERFLKAEELTQEVQLMQKVIRDKLVGSSSLAPPVASSSTPAPSEVASSTPAPLVPSNNPDAASEDLLPSEG